MRHLLLAMPFLLAAAPALAVPDSPELSQARSAFGFCMQKQIVAAGPQEAVEAIVDSAFAACRSEQKRLGDAVVASNATSAGTAAEAARRFEQEMAASRTNVIRYLASFRGAPARAAAVPTP